MNAKKPFCNPRGHCPSCGKEVALSGYTSGTLGSLRIRNHAAHGKWRCPGSGSLVRAAGEENT